MKRTIVLINSLLSMALIIAGCGNDDGGGSNILSCASGAGSYTDPTGDVGFAFIDLTNLMVTVTSTDITAEVELANLSGQLTYNDPSTPDNAKEYGWEVMFDVDGNGDCFSPGDIELAVLYFKPPNSSVITGSILQNEQTEVWIVQNNGNTAILVPAQSFTVTQSGNRLIMTVAKSAAQELSAITPNTPVRFETTHVSGGTRFNDRFPN